MFGDVCFPLVRFFVRIQRHTASKGRHFMAEYGPSVTAARLWEKTSAKGMTYLAGRMGNLRISILPNRDRKSDDDATHVLVFGEAQPREPRQEAPAPGRFPD